MSEHLTENEIERYAGRSLDSADLLRVDDHLAGCSDCRRKAFASTGLPSSVTGIRNGMTPSAPADLDHPDPELLAGYVDNTLDPVDREIVEGHLDICQNCASEVAELRSFQSVLSERAGQAYTPALAAGRFERMDTVRARRPVFRFAPAFAIAATLLIAAAVVWRVEHGQHAPAGPQVATLTQPAPIVEAPTVPLTEPTPFKNPPETREKPAPVVTPSAPAEKHSPIVTSSAPTREPEAPVLPKTQPFVAPAPSTFSGAAPVLNPIKINGPVRKTVNASKSALENATSSLEEAGPPTSSQKRVVAPAAPPLSNGGNYAAPLNGSVAPAAKSAPLLHPDDMIAMSAPAGNATASTTGKAMKVAALPDSVQRVIATGHLDLDTPEIHDLIGPAFSADNIGAPTATFTVTSPVSTAILTDRPTFIWQQAKDATGYQVSITDPSGSTVDASPVIASTTWKADKPLPRGELLKWRVNAMANGSELSTAPDGGARFRILDADRADQIRDAEKTFADQPLALGILYAQAGMLDEAERAFAQAHRQDPQNELVPKLIADLKAVRNSGLP